MFGDNRTSIYRDADNLVVLHDIVNPSNLDVAYSIPKVTDGYEVTPRDLVDMIYEADNFKGKHLGLKQVLPKNISVKKGEEAQGFVYTRPNQRYSIYLVEKGDKYLILTTYSYCHDSLKRHFAEKNRYAKFNTAYDFRDFTIPCHEGAQVFSPSLKVESLDTLVYTVRLGCNGFDKSTLQNWLDIATNKRVTVVSIKATVNNSGMHSFTKDLYEVTIKLKLKGVRSPTVTTEQLCGLFDHAVKTTNGNDLILVDYNFNSRQEKATTTVIRTNGQGVITNISDDSNFKYSSEKGKRLVNLSHELQGFKITDFKKQISQANKNF